MEKFVAVVICAVVALPAGGATASSGSGLLRTASQRSGLTIRWAVPEQRLQARRYEAVLRRAADRAYPRSLRDADAVLYARLGLLPAGSRADLTPRPSASTVWYDAAARSLLRRRATRAQRSRVINELVRALVDQHFGLRRLAGLRSRDRDAALAAEGIVDGIAALASGMIRPAVRGTALARFLQLDSGIAAGKLLAKQLRYLGGSRAVASSLKKFPQTTEQLLHVDKFLERERASPVRLPKRAGELTLRTSETFGELDLRSLLAAQRVAGAASVAAGWGGGRLSLYVSPGGEATAVLALRFDTYEDAVEWRDAIGRYVAAAFPGAPSSDCPPLDRCWSAATLGAATIGQTAVFASGPGAALLAAATVAAN